ncbi:MAG: hypothetical protein J0L77_06290 [Alphaproteobacteria bacterium]|nr:hypothetical protein [Alphaproteobacteria bacterium]
MIDEARLQLKILWEKSLKAVTGYKRAAAQSVWYTADPNYCLTETPAFNHPTLAPFIDRLGLADFCSEHQPGSSLIFPGYDAVKANGHPASQLMLYNEASPQIFSFIYWGSQLRIFITFKQPKHDVYEGDWHLDTVTLATPDKIFELDINYDSPHLQEIEDILDGFKIASWHLLTDPQATLEDSDTVIGKKLRPTIDKLKKEYALPKGTLATFDP